MIEVKDSDVRRKSLEDYEDDEELIETPVPDEKPPSKKRQRDTSRSRQPMEIEVKLSPRELAKRKEIANNISDELWDIEEQMRKIVKPLRKTASHLRAQFRKQREAIREGKELRNVVVDCLIDQAGGVVEIFYEGKRVKEITLQELKKFREDRINENQGDLFGKRSREQQAAKRP